VLGVILITEIKAWYVAVTQIGLAEFKEAGESDKSGGKFSECEAKTLLTTHKSSQSDKSADSRVNNFSRL